MKEKNDDGSLSKSIHAFSQICITLMQYINKIKNLILIIYEIILLVFVYCLNKRA